MDANDYIDKLIKKIVLKISSDKRSILGTGFYISKDLICTCYHVLADDNECLSKYYWICNDDWPHAENECTDWAIAEPVQQYCIKSPIDIAILFSHKEINDKNLIKIKTWNGKSRFFLSRGYDITKKKLGSLIVEGEILGETKLGGEKRLQLSVSKGSIKHGRSGSPIVNISDGSCVGMLDYHAGNHNYESDMILAIPLEGIPIKDVYEDIFRNLSLYVNKKRGFRVLYPTKWTKIEPSRGPVLVKFNSPSEIHPGDKEFIKISYAKLAKKSPAFSKIKEHFINKVKENVSDFEEIIVPCHVGFGVKYDEKKGNQVFKIIKIVVIKNSNSYNSYRYLIEYCLLKGNFESFKKCIYSFKFLV